MDPITLTIDGVAYRAFEVAWLDEQTTRLQGLASSLMSLPAVFPAREEPAVGPKGEAAPTNQLPIHRCQECGHAQVKKAGDLCAACCDRVKHIGLGGPALPKDSAGPNHTAPKPRAFPISSSGAPAKNTTPLPPKQPAGQTIVSVVQDALKTLGEADTAEIAAYLEKKGVMLGEDPIRQISGALFANLKIKGIADHVEGRRGYWRLVA